MKTLCFALAALAFPLAAQAGEAPSKAAYAEAYMAKLEQKQEARRARLSEARGEKTVAVSVAPRLSVLFAAAVRPELAPDVTTHNVPNN